jgi:hypothetical protein
MSPGDFNVTPEILTKVSERTVLGTVPFKVNGTSLVPLLGADSASMKTQAYTLMPGQSTTFSFKGVLELQRVYVLRGSRRIATPMIVIPLVVTPIVGHTYTIRLMNEGF